jgi:hypothetical protein
LLNVRIVALDPSGDIGLCADARCISAHSTQKAFVHLRTASSQFDVTLSGMRVSN